ncbi:unnamed protein product [Haemonchus placei]|uniref:Uncharacterized protein n=1 Tax=Haemonchus placei TaxID=6290 RepID=A0A0N4W5U9_HAEPC|nr:unnamed protein product [Haemonchus placei]
MSTRGEGDRAGRGEDCSRSVLLRTCTFICPEHSDRRRCQAENNDDEDDDDDDDSNGAAGHVRRWELRGRCGELKLRLRQLIHERQIDPRQSWHAANGALARQKLDDVVVVVAAPALCRRLASTTGTSDSTANDQCFVPGKNSYLASIIMSKATVVPS